MRYFIPLGIMLLQGCTAAPEQQGTFPDAMASPLTEPEPVASANIDADPRKRQVISGPDGTIYAFAPYASRDLSDVVAGCPHMNPQERPRGTNCFGIFPEQCGADRAKAHIGKVLEAGTRETIESYSPTQDVRFYHKGDALIEDLRFGRLNIELNDDDRVVSADCF